MTPPPPNLPTDFLRSCLLLLLREEQAHGYDLLERVREMGFGGFDPGGLYRTLRKLEAEELVRSTWERSDAGPQRRTYRITRAGMEELHARAKAIAAGQERTEAFLSRYEEFVALRRSAVARGGRVARSRTGAR